MTIQTGTFLDRIVARTIADIPARQTEQPLAELDTLAASRPPVVGFSTALRAEKTAVIAEVKRASPSTGAIAPSIDATTVAADYLTAGASAISVLTDTPFFQGSLADLRAVSEMAHAAEPPHPVLRKDFLVDPYQVAEARAHGADAVLLIVALLKGTRLREMLAVVRAYGLQALVEVHDEAELDEAVNAGAEVIGINNRDLRTFTVDLATSERLAPMVPADRTIVAESGIHTLDDLRRLAKGGAHAVLVGESLMKAADRQAALRGLIQ